MIIENALFVLYEQAKKRNLFWHNYIPKNYHTNKSYLGLNFLLLGVSPLSARDPRWGTIFDYADNNVMVEADQLATNILYWHKETEDSLKSLLTSLPVYNVSQTDDCEDEIDNREDMRLTDFLYTYKIPYQNSVNNSYSPLDNILYVNTENNKTGDFQAELKEEKKLFIKAIPAISKWIVHNSDWKNHYLAKNINKFLLPDFLFIVEDLVMYKLCFNFKINLKKCIDEELLCNSIQKLYEEKKYKLLLSAFLIADYIVISTFFQRQYLPTDLFYKFIGYNRTNEIMTGISQQEIDLLRQNMEECLYHSRMMYEDTENESKKEPKAYLRFVLIDEENNHIEYYVTDYDDYNIQNLTGITFYNGQDPTEVKHTTWDLSADYELDYLFKAKPLKEIYQRYEK